MGNTKVATTMNFSRVYTTHKDKMYSYVFYRVGSDKDLAEDVVSDVFLKAYKAYDSYDDRFAMSTWLYSIARNTLIDHYRKDREMVDIDGIDVTDQTDPLFKLIDADISVTELYEAIDSLPDAQRLYIRKQFIEGYSANEIAADEGVSHAAVRKSVSRGVAVLREKLLSIAILINFINI
jgi:RNA polymerase sigma-70 factor (ECF subfamily)